MVGHVGSASACKGRMTQAAQTGTRHYINGIGQGSDRIAELVKKEKEFICVRDLKKSESQHSSRVRSSRQRDSDRD